MSSAYIDKEFRCEKGFALFIQIFQELLQVPSYIWRRYCNFEGKLITKERSPGDWITGVWYCSAVLIEKNDGQRIWYPCWFYPTDKIEVGTYIQRRFGTIYKFETGRKILVPKIY